MLKTNGSTTIINKETRQQLVPLFLFSPTNSATLVVTHFSFPQTIKPSFK